ncbi:helicase associated domain-containing protein [Streptomyces sp. NPDC014006]|uniref:helicase associated domain-containing protein n=1 Tax=Streptomyces sp. NPDC014006 TaxID=3364870 RepID=UPI0036F99F69
MSASDHCSHPATARGACREGGSGQDQEEWQIRLGAWISNQRSRAATLSAERIEQLSAIAMRWT